MLILALGLVGVMLATFSLGADDTPDQVLNPEHDILIPGVTSGVEHTGQPPTSTAAPSATPEPTATPLPQAAWETLRVWTDGDSTSYFMSVALMPALRAKGATTVQPGPDYWISSRLSQWLGVLPGEMAEFAPNVVVLMVGANDASGCATSPETWRGQVREAMDMMEGRRFIWVGQPSVDPALRPDMWACVPPLNAVAREEAEAREWVAFIDTWAITTDAEGDYFSYGCNAFGQCGTMRAADGVHMTSFGGAHIAFHVLVAIELTR